MFKMLEKLINEHGSAKILKERLGLRDDQITSIKQEFTELTQDNIELKAENKDLKTLLNQANEEIQRLNETLKSNAEIVTTNEIGEIELKILEFMFENNRSFQIEQIAQIVGTNPNTAKYHINNLIDLGFVYNSLVVMGPTTYSINDNGIKYIIEGKST